MAYKIPDDAVINSKLQQLLRTSVNFRDHRPHRMRCHGEVRLRSTRYQKEEKMGNKYLFVKRMTALAMALLFLVASNITHVKAAPANNLTPEQIEAIVTDVFNKFSAFDAEGTAALYAPDGTIEDPVGTTPVQGTQAIIAYLQTYPTILNEIRIQAFDVTVAGQE